MLIFWFYNARVGVFKGNINSKVLSRERNHISSLKVNTGFGKGEVVFLCKGYNNFDNKFKEETILTITG